MQDDLSTSNNTYIDFMYFTYIRKNLKHFLSENVLDAFINPKVYFNVNI